ncbi:hypothetical protein IQ225_18715 [Synechocystis salina LEGE 06155]|uniref:Uncharacterized protein n=1 Tax=Synechocystis salina LEGE 00031 TaxID=1828736 RepID=A0ABR9VXF5_9SYNC|nr:hypothetical protein [Synechocystis salina]MBE9176853.1 hypothetical protein [Synechocystis salina LEGE 06155]MBE9241872.1 hypothetical protein [Synechocystis salina LEGE 00041]MBE9255083.1 hypothetical protein [Synechocystis salina LEGE 00031]
METRRYLAPIATQTPKTKKTPLALDGIEGVSKDIKANQSGDRYLKEGIVKTHSRHVPQKIWEGGVF